MHYLIRRNKPKPASNLQDFIGALEQEGELHRIKEQVSQDLEITEISTRAIQEGKPAILFENVRGCSFPLAINLLASERRIRIALGRCPEEIGEDILRFAEDMLPPTPAKIRRNIGNIGRLMNIRPKKIRRLADDCITMNPPDLTALPALKCWPHDGGRFITLPLVITSDPISGKPNMGMYRMHIFDTTSTGMHMQIQKGGGFHYYNAEALNLNLPVAVALGGSPILTISAITALPEGVDEMAFAGFLCGSRVRLYRTYSNVYVPAEAEFILEGFVPPSLRKTEGPFGDHFGHYSEAAPFPVFCLEKLHHRRNAIYPATVVGKPPMEDRFIGDASQMLAGPLIRLLRKDIHSMWAYYEAGFHNLLVISLIQRYTREATKTALGVLGEGQLSLTKVVVLVSAGVNPRSIGDVMEAIRRNFRPETGMKLIPHTAQDTLDFTGDAMHHGSKMIIDATDGSNSFNSPAGFKDTVHTYNAMFDERDLPGNVVKSRLVRHCTLIVQVSGNGREVIKSIVGNPKFKGIKLAIAVSNDIDINNTVELIWGIFTRFDCAKDVFFTRVDVKGICPEYGGVMGIDATWKNNYPKPLEMDPKVIAEVDSKWHLYWK